VAEIHSESHIPERTLPAERPDSLKSSNSEYAVDSGLTWTGGSYTTPKLFMAVAVDPGSRGFLNLNPTIEGGPRAAVGARPVRLNRHQVRYFSFACQFKVIVTGGGGGGC
jgi:hypothetical protein